MAAKKIIIVFAAILFLSEITLAQSIPAPYEVATWQGFCNGAVTFTFDDNCSNQFTVAIPMFNKADLKLTLFPVINWAGGVWTQLQAAANNGHEVASHTVTHPHLGALTDAQALTELQSSQQTIESHITGLKCQTIAYPYCETGNVALSKPYYFAARGCSGVIEPSTPSNFMNISSIVCGNQGSVQTTQDFKNKVDNAASSKGWVVFLIHGIDNDGGYSPVTTANLQGAVDYLSANKDKFWVQTFGNVARYIKERNNAAIKETSVNDSSITLQLTDTLDNAVFNYPITVRRQLPDGWPSATVAQKGKAVNARTVIVNSKKCVTFDVVPDAGDIVILKSMLTGVNSSEEHSELSAPMLMQNYPNPFNPKTKINYQIPEKSQITLTVYDMAGKEVCILVNEEKAPGNYEVEFDGNKYASGTYYYKLQAGNYVSTKKLVLMK